MTKQTLYIVRGVSGAGKTSFVNNLLRTLPDAVTFAADDTFYDSSGNYKFEPHRLSYAHKQCLVKTKDALACSIEHVFVCNTFTKEWEMEEYFEMAAAHEYRVVSLIVENRHGSENVHNVPSKTIKNMKQRFSIKL